jgi:hypothetical protein
VTEDIEALQTLTTIFIWIAAVCTTSFPLLYAFSPWYKTPLGRVVMLQAGAFALAIDVTLIARYWTSPDDLTMFLINNLVFGVIALATASMTYLLWKANYEVRRKEELHNRRSTDGTGLPDQ